MGIKNWVRQRVSLVAGQPQIYEPKSRSTNALYIINNNAAELKAAAWSDVSNNPEVTVKANSAAPMPLSAAGEAVYLYCASSVTVTVVEMTTDDLAVVFAMQVVVSEAVTVTGNVGISGSIPAGTNNIGDVDVLTLPALPAGTNNIGDVDVASLPYVNTQIFASVAVAAGATLLASPENYDMAGYTFAHLVGYGEVSHSWTLQINQRGIDGGTEVTGTSAAGVGQGKSFSHRMAGQYARPFLINNDAVSHTYNLWLRRTIG